MQVFLLRQACLLLGANSCCKTNLVFHQVTQFFFQHILLPFLPSLYPMFSFFPRDYHEDPEDVEWEGDL